MGLSLRFVENVGIFLVTTLGTAARDTYAA